MQPFRLKNGEIFVIVESPGGIYNATQLKLMGELTEQHNLLAKITEDQRVGWMIPEELFDTLNDELANVGLSFRHYMSGLHQPASCIGGACPLAQQDALQTAVELSTSLDRELTENPFRIAVNGCSQACVPAYLYDVALQGTNAGYNIAIGGRSRKFNDLASLVATKVPADKVVECVSKIIAIYKKQAGDQDTLNDVIEKTGMKPFLDALVPYSKNLEKDDIDLEDLSGSEDIELSSEDVLLKEEDDELLNLSEEKTVEEDLLDLDENPPTSKDEDDWMDVKEEPKKSSDHSHELLNLHDEPEEEAVEEVAPKTAPSFETVSEEDLSEEMEEESPSPISKGSSFITDIDVNQDLLQVTFDSGVTIELDIQNMDHGPHAIHINKQDLVIEKERRSVKVQSGGTTVKVPVR